jgi:hypothetical protein
MRTRFVIEHPSWGCFIVTGDYQPKFQWSKVRTDTDTQWWYDRLEAEKVLKRVQETARSGHKAYVLEIPERAWKT